jgi:F0F1-type ATP synthase membrane subunit b/b'
MSTQTTEELSAAEYLENALEDLNKARKDATDDLRSMIDSAISRSREALDHLRVDAEDRAEHLKERAENRATEWQQMLEDASADVRRELAIRTVRAQRSDEALKEISDEIKHQKKELAASR